MVWTFGAGCAMGLFVPSLAIGAAYGQICGRTVGAVLAALEITSVRPSLHTYAVVGAAGALGGATRMTISITVLVMETTGSLQLIVPIMFTIFCSKWIGDHIFDGIYDAVIHTRGAPFLVEHKFSSIKGKAFQAAEKLRVQEVMSGGNVLVTLKPVMPVADILDVLARCRHGAFPVTPDTPTERHPTFKLH
eukprot:5279507-Pyramimonas_sp.AAC.1